MVGYDNLMSERIKIGHLNYRKCATNICAGSVALPLLGVGKKRSRSDI